MMRTTDKQFSKIVKGLEWKLDDGSSGGEPPRSLEFDHSPGGFGIPMWFQRVALYLVGILGGSAAVLRPWWVLGVVLLPALMYGAYAIRRRLP